MSKSALTQTAAPQEALVIMARYPEEGAVKTRLARDLGPRQTIRLYRAFIDDLAGKFGTLHRPLIWYYFPESSPFAQLFSQRYPCRPQAGSSLQERMLRIFEDLFGEGFQRVVVIGADVPHIPVEAVEEAFALLSAMDVILRPSSDGGYHLIGLRAAGDLFSGISMGTDRVLRETVERACIDGAFGALPGAVLRCRHDRRCETAYSISGRNGRPAAANP